MKISVEHRRPAHSANAWLRESDGEIAVYNRDRGDVFLMNETARAIWDLCDGQTRPDEMIRAICELSGMHVEIVREDVERILTEFDSAGLIVWQE